MYLDIHIYNRFLCLNDPCEYLLELILFAFVLHVAWFYGTLLFDVNCPFCNLGHIFNTLIVQV